MREPKRWLISKVLKTLGPERTSTLLAEALRLEDNGGMLTRDGSRRRTPGGTFFRLVKDCTSAKERWRIFPGPTPSQGPRKLPPTHAAPQPLTADALRTMIPTLSQGDATVKVTLIGRPDLQAIRTQPTYVAFRMQGKEPGALPKGLPPVPGQAPITWLVTIALRQWNRVKDRLAANAADKLIIEGYPVVTGDGAHVLLTQSCKSMLEQRTLNQAQQAAVQEADA